VAFPEEMRKRYTAHLTGMTGQAPQLLICYDYDQSLMEGPPFSVSDDEIKRHYAVHYDVTLISSTDVSGGLKGKCPAKENVWLLHHM
jgi:thiopurine S-methyltransferase